MEIVGKPPALAGHECEAFICEGFINKGAPVADANTVHLCFDGIWHRLILDCGVIIWRRSDSRPSPWGVESEGWEYPHVDVGAITGITGRQLRAYQMQQDADGCKVVFQFDGGRDIAIVNENDRSNFHVV